MRKVVLIVPLATDHYHWFILMSKGFFPQLIILLNILELLDLKTILGLAAGALTGIIGWVGRIFWERRASEWAVSTQEILTDLENGKYLTSKSRRKTRVQREANINLANWKRESSAPSDGRKLSSIDAIPKHKFIFVRDIYTLDLASSCPGGDPNVLTTPLFFQLKASQTNDVSNPVVEGSAASQKKDGLVTEFENKFLALENTYKLSKELIKAIFSETEIKIWIEVSNVIVRKKEDLHYLHERLSKVANERIPVAKIIVEVYLSDDLKDQLSEYVIRTSLGTDKTKPAPPTNESAFYVYARNKAISVISTGVILGKLQIPTHHFLPSDIIEERIKANFADGKIDINSWTAISVSGSPGVGKTELTSDLINRLQADSNSIILVASTPGLLKELENILTHSSIREAHRSIVSTIFASPRDDELIPDIEEGSIWRRAFSDALFEILAGKKQPIVILVDDVHAYSGIVALIQKLRQQYSNWGLRFILVGRTPIEPLTDEKLKSVHFRLWNRKEASQILGSWLKDKSEKEIEELFDKEWSRDRTQFSLYLLRIIAKHSDVDSESISKLLNDEVHKLLESVVKEIQEKRFRESPAVVLEKVQKMLLAENNYKDILSVIGKKNVNIDPVLLFGELAWTSRYKYAKMFDKHNVVEYIQNYVTDEQTAEALLQSGYTAKIFKKGKGVYSWHDTLVADVCATLYLGDKISGLRIKEGFQSPDKNKRDAEEEKTVVEMLASLDKSGSADFLGLALDASHLIRIITIITDLRPELSHIIDKFLTPEFISRLGPDLAEQIADDFWNVGCSNKIKPNHMGPPALAIIKLLSTEDLNRRCQRTIEAGDTDAAFALAVKTLQLLDDENYFAEVGQYAPEYLSPTIVEMPARFWSSKGIASINANLVSPRNSYFEKTEIRRVSSLLCKRQETAAALFFMIDDLISQLQNHPEREPLIRLVMEEYLKELGNRSPAERLKCVPHTNHLKRKTTELAKQGIPLASILVKWVAYFYCPDIVSKDGSWIIEKNGSWAIPKNPIEPTIIAHIFEKILDIYPKFEIAALGEIRLKQCSSARDYELVRDKFPRGFDYAGAIFPANLKIWKADSNSESIISKEQIQTMKVAWRPRFNLTQ